MTLQIDNPGNMGVMSCLIRDLRALNALILQNVRYYQQLTIQNDSSVCTVIFFTELLWS